MSYSNFLKSKGHRVKASGFGIDPEAINPVLFPFQRDLVRWALRKGRAAIFADTGLGKTFMQIEVTRLCAEKTGTPSLIVAPLSVAQQTIDEAAKLGVRVAYSDTGEAHYPITITNYEQVHKFNPSDFGSIGLDESSILKSESGKYRGMLIDMWSVCPYRSCYTATPAPNDIAEMANHAEFLGIMKRTEMLSAFFTHDSTGWRLKHHASEAFYTWLASWGMAVKKPSDLGYSDEGYDLPPLNIKPVWVDVDQKDVAPEGQLFFTKLSGVSHRSKVRRKTMPDRVKAAAELANDSDEQWIMWCGLNDESQKLTKLIPDAVEVTGSMKPSQKIEAIRAFQRGEVRVLVTKVKIAGMGMNFQNAHNMTFVGLSDSWEQYYQAIRREWRFGQEHEVNVHIVLSSVEDVIFNNIQNKEREAKQMTDQLIKNVAQYAKAELEDVPQAEWYYNEDMAHGKNWRLLLGDSVERLKELDENSIDEVVTSIPFLSLFAYTPTDRDLGNCISEAEFFEHFAFIRDELMRVVKPGRVVAIHVMDVPAMLVRDGYIGLKDFSGDVIRCMIDGEWIFDSRIPIDKNQQAQSIRTHSKALTMSQFEKDRSWNRPALPDYILKFRKPGENAEPVKNDDMDRNTWIEWANPTWPSANGDMCADSGAHATWYGISESDTLQGWQKARGNKDERHVCPLQLETIHRCVILWTNPGDTVLDPFNGIGSTGVVCIDTGRRYIGIELKPEYYNVSCKNLARAEAENTQVDLFAFAGLEVG